MTKCERVLRYIESHPEGLRLIDIQTFILKMNGIPNAIDEKTGLRKHEHRGWWTDAMFHNYPGDTKTGFMYKFCTKVNGRWFVTQPIEGPFTSGRNGEYKANMKRLELEHRIRISKLPTCKFCGRKQFAHNSQTSDGACIHTSSINGYMIDCRNYVWYTVDRDYQDAQVTDLTRDQVSHMDTNTDNRDRNQQFVKSHIVKWS